MLGNFSELNLYSGLYSVNPINYENYYLANMSQMESFYGLSKIRNTDIYISLVFSISMTDSSDELVVDLSSGRYDFI